MLRLLVLPAAFCVVVLLAACSDEPESSSTRPARPPVELNDDVVERLLAAAEELRDLSRAHPSAGGGVLPISLGITALLGEEACEPIVRRHGFSNCRDFESRLGYVQALIMERLLESRHGYDADAQRYSIRAALQEARDELAAVDREPGLSESERRERRTTVRSRIAALEERLADVEENAGDIDAQFARIPEEARRAVAARLDRLIALIAPQLSRTPTASGDTQENR